MGKQAHQPREPAGPRCCQGYYATMLNDLYYVREPPGCSVQGSGMRRALRRAAEDLRFLLMRHWRVLVLNGHI